MPFRMFFNIFILRKNLKKMVNGEEFIVTLTTHKGRIGIIDKTIQSLLNQNVKADRIVIIISEEEFPDGINGFTDTFKKFVSNGDVEVYKVSNDIKAFKKLIPTLLLYRNAFVMTADDDVIYPKGHISGHISFLEQNEYKTPISCNKCYKYNGSGDHGSIYRYSDICERMDVLTDARLINLRQDDLVYGLAVSGSKKNYTHRNYQVPGANNIVGLSRTINHKRNILLAEKYVNETFGVSLSDYRNHKFHQYNGTSSFIVEGIYDAYRLDDKIENGIVLLRRSKLDNSVFEEPKQKNNRILNKSVYY